MSSKIYIMPAGSIGAISYYVLKNNNHIFTELLGSKVSGFIDNIRGKTENAEFCGLPVKIPENIDRSARVIVASFRYGKKLIQQLHKLGFTDIVSADSFLTQENTSSVLEQMQEDNIEQRYNLISIQDSLRGFFIDAGNENDALTITRAEFVITQRCTLKCRDCSTLIQYYEKPVDLNIDGVIESVDRLFEFVESVRSVNIIGGEPFIVKGIAPLIDKLEAYRTRIGELIIITNGTIVPDSETIISMRRADLVVRISDYGELSRKINELQERLSENGVRYEIKRDLHWSIQRSFSNATNSGEETFRNCETWCAQIMDGKLYYCNFAAHGDALRAFPFNKDNYIELLSPDTNKETIRTYIERTCALPACQYCTGINLSNESIPVAVQTKVPLPYKKYE